MKLSSARSRSKIMREMKFYEIWSVIIGRAGAIDNFRDKIVSWSVFIRKGHASSRNRERKTIMQRVEHVPRLASRVLLDVTFQETITIEPPGYHPQPKLLLRFVASASIDRIYSMVCRCGLACLYYVHTFRGKCSIDTREKLYIQDNGQCSTCLSL